MNRWQRFLCNVMGWHKPGAAVVWIGGDNRRAICRRCGRVILWSTGGWFAAGEREDRLAHEAEIERHEIALQIARSENLNREKP